MNFFSLCFVFKVDGGCDIYLKVSWSQKLLYRDGQFTVDVPFNFPDYVSPFAKIFSKREKIQLNVNIGAKKEVIIRTTSHALKVICSSIGSVNLLTGLGSILS